MVNNREVSSPQRPKIIIIDEYNPNSEVIDPIRANEEYLNLELTFNFMASLDFYRSNILFEHPILV